MCVCLLCLSVLCDLIMNCKVVLCRASQFYTEMVTLCVCVYVYVCVYMYVCVCVWFGVWGMWSVGYGVAGGVMVGGCVI